MAHRLTWIVLLAPAMAFRSPVALDFLARVRANDCGAAAAASARRFIVGDEVLGRVLPQAADLFLVYVLGIFVALSIARNVLYKPPAKAPTRKPPAKKGSTPPSRGKKSMV